MIKRLVLAVMLLCLFIAIPLYLLGVRKVELGTPFIAFLNRCNEDLADFTIAIPNIPSIPKSPNLNTFWAILNAFISFGNFIIGFVNIGITFINVVISFLEFIVIMVKNLISLKDVLNDYAIVRTSSSLPPSSFPLL